MRISRLGQVTGLPPLEALYFFEAAARLGSFARAARELGVTPGAVSHRIKVLEEYLGARLFERRPQEVRLNRLGRAYLADVQRVLVQFRDVMKHRHGSGELLKLVAVEAVAEKWLMPRLMGFRAANPDIAIEFETDHRPVDPARRDFDLWIAFTNEIGGQFHAETLFEETLLPVCSPAFVAERGHPGEASDLLGWPLLYDLHWKSDWAHWFAHQGVQPPDLSRALGFRLYSMVVHAAVAGMGVALGHLLLIEQELEQGLLVRLCDTPVPAPGRYVLVTSPDSRDKPGVRAFKEWLLNWRSGEEGGKVFDITNRRCTVSPSPRVRRSGMREAGRLETFKP